MPGNNWKRWDKEGNFAFFQPLGGQWIPLHWPLGGCFETALGKSHSRVKRQVMTFARADLIRPNLHSLSQWETLSRVSHCSFGKKLRFFPIFSRLEITRETSNLSWYIRNCLEAIALYLDIYRDLFRNKAFKKGLALETGFIPWSL